MLVRPVSIHSKNLGIAGTVRRKGDVQAVRRPAWTFIAPSARGELTDLAGLEVVHYYIERTPFDSRCPGNLTELP